MESIEDLTQPVLTVNKALSTMHHHFTRLKEVNNSLVEFNQSFGAFLFGMAANDATLEWKETFPDDYINRYKSTPTPLTTVNTTAPLPPPPPVTDHVPAAKKRRLTKDKSTTTKSSHVAKIQIRKVIDHLPLKYREQTQNVIYMESVLKVLKLHPEGLHLKSLVAETKMPQYKVTECVNALVHSKDVLKKSNKGEYATFRLDPSRYPTMNKQA